jgi:hypothetical protein
MRSNLCVFLAALMSLSAAPLFMMAVVVLCGFAAWSPAATVHYGNDVEFTDLSDHQPDYLLGSKYSVTQPIVLQKAGIIFKDFSAYNAKVGIYTDAGGAPHTLVAETGSFAVMVFAGRTETPLLTTPTIPAGDYWFMAVFDAYASVGISYDDGPQVAYHAHKFNSPLPATFPAPLIYTGHAFNYYLVGETTLSGDYNQNGVVDAADYVVWRKSPSTFGGNPEGYNTWRAQFGQTSGGGAAASMNAVPEPSSLALLALAGLAQLRRRSRSRLLIAQSYR